jgi:hypothetical protein
MNVSPRPQFRTYMVLETSWWVGVYAICFRWQPTVLLMQTSWGGLAVRRAGAWLQRAWPSRYDSIAKSAERVYASPNGRTFGEWMLINKILAPVSFPAKLALANRIVNQRAALAGAGAAGATALIAVDAAAAAEPDLSTKTVEEPKERAVRTISAQAQATAAAVTKQ